MPGALLVDIAGLELTAEDREILLHPLVCGLVLFSRNYVSKTQLTDLTQQIHALRSELIITVDQEGGRVQRFREEFTKFPPAAEWGKLYDENPAEALLQVKQTAGLLARELQTVGVDLSFAPVLDLQNLQSRVIGDRAFHADPHIVTLLGEQFIAGFHAAGMAAVGKHFPGHGTVLADSHCEEPIDPRKFSELMATDLIPFVRLAKKLQGIMPAHVIYSALDPQPAGFSPYWLKKILREQLKFTGIIFSDDLTMQAAAKIGDYPARFNAAIEAGCDIGLVCNNRAGAIAVLDQVKNYAPDWQKIETLKPRKK